MKRFKHTKTAILSLALASALAGTPLHAAARDGMKEGTADMQSVGALTFGAEGILFAADPRGAAVFAIACDDKPAPAAGDIHIDKVDLKMAAALGTTADNILIEDLAVNPGTGIAYVSVSRGRGPDAKPALVRIADGAIGIVSLDNVLFSKAALSDAPEDKVVGEGRRAENRRTSSITDMAWVDGRLAVAGLSNEEFASSLRVLDFPFTGKESSSSVEIYHGAHGKFETHSPIRTLVPLHIAGEPNIVASYTCTPLVTIPLGQIKADAHVKGRTVAELGNRNRPLDMIEYAKDGGEFILMANSARGMMKIDTKGIETADAITERVEGTKGLPYETVADWSGIVQLAKLSDSKALVLRQDDSGSHVLSLALP